MSRKTINLFVFSFIIMFTYSCRDFFEKDLNKSEIKTIAPVENSRFVDLNVNFSWEKVDGALEYRIKVGSPSLNNPTIYFVDSTTEKLSANYNLVPGDYEWQVQATNNSSETPFSKQIFFTIDSSFNLNDHSIQLISPKNNTFSNEPRFVFQCQDLYAIEDYNFIIKKGNDLLTAIDFWDTLISNTRIINTKLLDEGNYFWTVKGLNSLPSETEAEPFNLGIDLTNPSQPILQSPNEVTTGLLTDSSYFFNWGRQANLGTVQSPLYDSLFIHEDSLESAISSYKVLDPDTTITLPSVSNNYFWTVITYDEAGNQSEKAWYKMFTIN